MLSSNAGGEGRSAGQGYINRIHGASGQIASAARGVALDNAFVQCLVCMASRAAIHT